MTGVITWWAFHRCTCRLLMNVAVVKWTFTDVWFTFLLWDKPVCQGQSPHHLLFQTPAFPGVFISSRSVRSSLSCRGLGIAFLEAPSDNMPNHLHGLRCQPSCSAKLSDLTDTLTVVLASSWMTDRVKMHLGQLMSDKVLTFSTSPCRKWFLILCWKTVRPKSVLSFAAQVFGSKVTFNS